MRSGVMDGDRWIVQRLAFLRELLQGDMSDEDRQAVESEIAVLSKESGIRAGGHRRFRLLRRLRKQ